MPKSKPKANPVTTPRQQAGRFSSDRSISPVWRSCTRRRKDRFPRLCGFDFEHRSRGLPRVQCPRKPANTALCWMTSATNSTMGRAPSNRSRLAIPFAGNVHAASSTLALPFRVLPQSAAFSNLWLTAPRGHRPAPQSEIRSSCRERGRRYCTSLTPAKGVINGRPFRLTLSRHRLSHGTLRWTLATASVLPESMTEREAPWQRTQEVARVPSRGCVGTEFLFQNRSTLAEIEEDDCGPIPAKWFRHHQQPRPPALKRVRDSDSTLQCVSGSLETLRKSRAAPDRNRRS